MGRLVHDGFYMMHGQASTRIARISVSVYKHEAQHEGTNVLWTDHPWLELEVSEMAPREYRQVVSYSSSS